MPETRQTIGNRGFMSEDVLNTEKATLEGKSCIVAFEGIDCMGKSTLIEALGKKIKECEQLKKYKLHRISLSGNNMNDIEIAKLRSRALHGDLTDERRQNIFIDIAKRVSHYIKKQDYNIYILDRYIDSAMSYGQFDDAGIFREFSEAIIKIYRSMPVPDIVALLTTGDASLDVHLMRRRLDERPVIKDSIESRSDDYHLAVADHFISDPEHRVGGEDFATLVNVHPEMETEDQADVMLQLILDDVIDPLESRLDSEEIYYGDVTRLE